MHIKIMQIRNPVIENGLRLYQYVDKLLLSSEI